MANFRKVAPAILVLASVVSLSHSAQAEDPAPTTANPRYLMLLPFLLPHATTPAATPAAKPPATPVAAPVVAPVAAPAVVPPAPSPPAPPPPPVVQPSAPPPAVLPPTVGGPLTAILNGQNECRPGAASASTAATPPHNNKTDGKTDGKAPYDSTPQYGGGSFCSVGDLNAVGSVTVLLARRGSAVYLCYGLDEAGLYAPTGAHIHRGRAGVNGPSVVILTPPSSPSNDDRGASSGCVMVSRALAAAIHANPMAYYVDIETNAFPKGAIRGQLR